MTILHIADISNDPYNGVCQAAPMHAVSQNEFEKVAFINISNIRIKILEENNIKQLEYNKPFKLSDYPKPFNEPNLVILHECYRKEYLYIAKKLKANKIPYIIMPHGELRHEAQKKKYLKKRLANALLFNKIIENAAAIQCLSKYELENTNFNAVKFIGTNGINPPHFTKNNFNRNGTRIIYIGRLDSYHKGLDLLIESVSIMKEKMIASNTKIDIYGPDIKGRSAYLKKLINRYKVNQIITVHNAISGHLKEKILLKSDIFIQTSRFEGMPLGILEALSYGIPCFVTDGTNLGTEIEEYGAGWRANNAPEAIAEKLSIALKEKKYYNKYGKNGIKFINKKYSWRNISKNTVNTYKKLLG